MTFSKMLPKRLVTAKRILNHGLEHGKRSGEINRLFSIISLDGAVENFLHVVITELHGQLTNIKNPGFHEVFKAADEATKKATEDHLPFKLDMASLHDSRNYAQHKGVIPSASSIETFMFYATEFLRKSFEICFRISFDEIFLADAIQDVDLKNIMKDAEDQIVRKDFESAARNVAWAFGVLQIKKEKQELWRKKLSQHSRHQIIQVVRDSFDKDKFSQANRFKDIIESIIEEIEFLNRRIDVLSLGANIQEYLFFMKNTPWVAIMSDGSPRFAVTKPIQFSHENIMKNFNFVYNLILTWEGSMYSENE